MTDGSRWIAGARPRFAARLRLFCFSFAGGGAQAFRGVAAAVSDDVEVCAVQPPGRFARLRERSYTRMEPLVQAATDALSPLCDRSYAVFGYSLGALVGFAACRELARRGRASPEHLFAWQRHTSGECRTELFEGSHFILDSREVLARVAACLEDVVRGRRTANRAVGGEPSGWSPRRQAAPRAAPDESEA
jgi:surfactin synthase thioesterase subunit